MIFKKIHLIKEDKLKDVCFPVPYLVGSASDRFQIHTNDTNKKIGWEGTNIKNSYYYIDHSLLVVSYISQRN